MESPRDKWSVFRTGGRADGASFWSGKCFLKLAMEEAVMGDQVLKHEDQSLDPWLPVISAFRSSGFK